MTEKHFIALADTIKRKRMDFSENAITALAHFCENQSPQFDRWRWRDYIDDKCGPNGGRVKPKPLGKVLARNAAFNRNAKADVKGSLGIR